VTLSQSLPFLAKCGPVHHVKRRPAATIVRAEGSATRVENVFAILTGWESVAKSQPAHMPVTAMEDVKRGSVNATICGQERPVNKDNIGAQKIAVVVVFASRVQTERIRVNAINCPRMLAFARLLSRCSKDNDGLVQLARSYRAQLTVKAKNAVGMEAARMVSANVTKVSLAIYAKFLFVKTHVT
jgi:hypothetical protein